MKRFWNPSYGEILIPIRNKIILSLALYILVIGIVGSYYLYTYLEKSVFAKAERLDRMNLETVKNLLDREFNALFSLAILCASDPLVTRAVYSTERSSYGRLRDALAAQERINTYIQANTAGRWVNALILSEGEGPHVFVLGRRTGAPDDMERLRNHSLFIEYKTSGQPWVSGFAPSATWGRQPDIYGIFVSVPGYSEAGEAGGFIYLEAGLDMVTAAFRDFPLLPGLSAAVKEGRISSDNFLIPAGWAPDGEYSGSVRDGLRYRRGNRRFRLDILPLESVDMTLYNEVDITELHADDRDIFFIAFIVVLGSILIGAGMALALSLVLTRPIQRLISRIKRIGENDLSYDPEIEKSRDEIGQIGRALNEMSGNIARLMAEMEESFRQQRSAELALLQLRINPHFLYNTLESIRWMAKIQKNSAIADMSASLINLLRNIAGNPKDLIPLEDELRLLEDYTAVMTIRFMGIFSMENQIDRSLYKFLIPKLTLQPLVENAIIHGITPSGIFGSIVLKGKLEGSWLILTIEDSGLGMSEEKLKNIFRQRAEKSGTSLNNIGVKNVDERLKLLYGEDAGLSFESEEKKFTRVTVHLKAQSAPVNAVRTSAKEEEDAPSASG